MPNYVGPGLALDADGFHAACDALGVAAAELWAVLSVETSGCGYLATRKPKILFERHYFSRLTNHRYDQQAPDVSNPQAGGYGAGGEHQYERLDKAYALDATAALQSASWGIGQVMGTSYAVGGFASVDAMVAAMVASEDAQLATMAGFIRTNNLATALRLHDWPSFARGYNGPNYAQNNYDGQLQANYQKWANGPLPDLTVRAAQIYLTYLGIDPHGIDGLSGRHTIDALNTYLARKGRGPIDHLDDDTFALLKADATASAAPPSA